MKLVKSLLLGSAALIAAAAGAQAADLPFRKAAPVDYVRVCDWTGTGYFYIPGTDTCLKIGGYVYAEYAYVTGGSSLTPTPTGRGAANLNQTITSGKARAQTGFFLRGNFNMDARTQTAYGTLRTYVELRMDRYSGTYNNSGFGGLANHTSAANGDFSTPYLYKAYIQFAGLTAGRVQSFFDFYADNYNFDGIANSDTDSEVIAYTANFAGGFSSTISIENRDDRNDGIGNTWRGNGQVGNVGYAGQTIPDIVGAVNLDQAWGRAQLSAAYHDVNTTGQAGTIFNGIQGNTIAKDAAGWAVNAGVMFKLPMLAAGDELWIEGGYMNGAVSYQEEAGNLNNGFYGQLVPGFQHEDVDAVAVANGRGGYTLDQAHGWHILAGLKHYWSPQFHTFTFGSYEEINYPGAVTHLDWTQGGLGNASEFRVGNQFIFTPVNNLDIGLEVMYARIDQKLAGGAGGVAPTALPDGIKQNGDVFTTKLKLERDF